MNPTQPTPPTPASTPTPRTDHVAKIIGRLVAQWKSGELGAFSFAHEADQALYPLREMEQQLTAAKAERDEARKGMQVQPLLKHLHDAQAELAALRTRLKGAEEDLERYRSHMREKIYVDAAPDAGLPVRILSAHIEDGRTESMPPELGNLMNKWQAERNVILRDAIAQLAAAPSVAPVMGGEELAKLTNDELRDMVHSPGGSGAQGAAAYAEIGRRMLADFQQEHAPAPSVAQPPEQRSLGKSHDSSLSASEANPALIRFAWEAGIKIAKSYGDNVFHLADEQKERQYRAFLASSGYKHFAAALPSVANPAQRDGERLDWLEGNTHHPCAGETRDSDPHMTITFLIPRNNYSPDYSIRAAIDAAMRAATSAPASGGPEGER